jgi:hypothetical protein
MDQREITGQEKKIPVGARFSAQVQTSPGAYPASCTMGTGSLPGLKRPGRGVDQHTIRPPHSPYLILTRKYRVIMDIREVFNFRKRIFLYTVNYNTTDVAYLF